ncbi:putative sterigmatocystin 8-o-methyltransferase protein [Eutypa lata UCREL1]|uniref:Putative sterigmatocystin 8-o-methyltransferase protein n=1 Tax=Eutypa lata (strain UCR-EL1) TaxID=1287681 RepID=M7T6Y9_EUTLA|nr:putative sterigmatocystin 8-o-methyltransferase protein [Eutypa lata UCREL1]
MKKTGYKMPNSMAGGALQYAYKTKLGLFGHLQANPPYGELFSHFMAGYHEGRPSWMDPGFFPIQEKLIDGARHGDGEVFLVDIAGATGYDLEEYLQKHPSPPGRLVLQDLPAVIGQIYNLSEEIERMSYDFFTEQPLKGSRVYFMHYILHDWSDETCLKILARVTEAMEPGYSKFLINENVVPSRNAHWDTTALDMQLMITLSSRERTEEDWISLLKAGGLKICKIWSVSGGCECLIECELARTNPATGFD